MRKAAHFLTMFVLIVPIAAGVAFYGFLVSCATCIECLANILNEP